MSSSKAMQDILSKALKKVKGSQRNKVSYTFSTSDNRNENTVATSVIQFNRPVTEEELNKKLPNILREVESSINGRELGVVNALLSRYGLHDRVGKKKVSGDVNVYLGQSIEEEGESGAIQTPTGKFISEVNLKSTLEVLAKGYLIKEMKKPTAPLKFQTGRFASSMEVTSLAKFEGRSPSVSIFYTYMTYPYATFDPQRSTRPEMYARPSYGARNPQVHIGDALAKAARDLINKRFRIEVKETI